MEAYLQDTYRFTSQGGHSHFTLNYGVRMSHWSLNKETLFSPRISLGIIPAYSENTTLRFAAGLYYQAPFFKELRDTSTVNGITYATLNEKIKSPRSIHFIAGYDYRFRINNLRYRFTAEAYYKALGNLIPYSVNNVKVVYYGENRASGHAAGIDLKLYGEFVPGTDSWLTLLADEYTDETQRKGRAATYRPAICRKPLLHGLLPRNRAVENVAKTCSADGLPFSTPHRELETNTFRAPAYKRADIGMSYRLLDNSKGTKKSIFKNIGWV